jgi:glycosyltransferase involved in cell wall biosynthesis
MRIAMLGTRGVPARYGGFETAVEEIGQRLVLRGHEVTVYCRDARRTSPDTYLGMRLVHLPSVKGKALETPTHMALSALHLATHPRHDVAIVFNSANAPFLPLMRLARTPVAVHVDGLEWKRAKWGWAGRRYYRWAESYAVRWADALIADAQGIADYYAEEFGADTELLSYGAPIQVSPCRDRLPELEVAPEGYHLVVARFEPENHVEEIVAGYRRSSAERPLLVVGSAPYADEYTTRVRRAAGDDPRIRILGGLWDQDQLDQLYAHCLTYVHGHSVGGTNPSLLRAMGAGTDVIAYDVSFNREVLGECGSYFAQPADLPDLFHAAERRPDLARRRGAHHRSRAANLYDWLEVSAGYEQLCKKLDGGELVRGAASGRRRTPVDGM